MSDSALTVREFRKSDFRSVQQLLKSNGLNSISSADWSRRNRLNPLLRRNTGISRGWIIEAESRIVGHLGSIPVEYQLNGRTFVIMVATNWAIDLDYRRCASVLLHKFFDQPFADGFLNTTASEAAGRLFAAFGAIRLPQPDYDTALVQPISYTRVAKSLLLDRKIPLSAMWSYPVGALLKGIGALRSQKVIDPRNVRRIDAFDDRFDKFWQVLAGRRDTFMAVRSRSWLEWHCSGQAPGRLMILTLESKGCLQGYAILKRQDSRNLGLRRLRLVDLQVIDDAADHVAQLLHAAAVHALADGIHVMESVGFTGSKRRILEQSWPHRRPLPVWPFFFKLNDSSVADGLGHEITWDACLFDGDTAL